MKYCPRSRLFVPCYVAGVVLQLYVRNVNYIFYNGRGLQFRALSIETSQGRLHNRYNCIARTPSAILHHFFMVFRNVTRRLASDEAGHRYRVPSQASEVLSRMQCTAERECTTYFQQILKKSRSSLLIIIFNLTFSLLRAAYKSSILNIIFKIIKIEHVKFDKVSYCYKVVIGPKKSFAMLIASNIHEEFSTFHSITKVLTFDLRKGITRAWMPRISQLRATFFAASQMAICTRLATVCFKLRSPGMVLIGVGVLPLNRAYDCAYE